jgi:hypothetical protein
LSIAERAAKLGSYSFQSLFKLVFWLGLSVEAVNFAARLDKALCYGQTQTLSTACDTSIRTSRISEHLLAQSNTSDNMDAAAKIEIRELFAANILHGIASFRGYQRRMCS